MIENAEDDESDTKVAQDLNTDGEVEVAEASANTYE